MMQDDMPEDCYYYWPADSTHQSTASFESEPETDECDQHRAVSPKEGPSSKVCALAAELDFLYDDADDDNDTAPFALWKPSPFVLALSKSLLYGAKTQDLTRTRSEPMPSAACQEHLTASFEFEPEADDWGQFVDF